MQLLVFSVTLFSCVFIACPLLLPLLLRWLIALGWFSVFSNFDLAMCCSSASRHVLFKREVFKCSHSLFQARCVQARSLTSREVFKRSH